MYVSVLQFKGASDVQTFSIFHFHPDSLKWLLCYFSFNPEGRCYLQSQGMVERFSNWKQSCFAIDCWNYIYAWAGLQWGSQAHTLWRNSGFVCYYVYLYPRSFDGVEFEYWTIWMRLDSCKCSMNFDCQTASVQVDFLYGIATEILLMKK